MIQILSNATLVELYPGRVEKQDLRIDGESIASESTQEATSQVIDCTGRIVMPGSVCAHTHLYSALARGMPPPARPPRNFIEILELVWWRLDRALDGPSIFSSGLAGCLDAVRAGTTTLIDHHASPNHIDGSLDLLADALDTVGIRGVLCYEVTDRGGMERRDAGLRENDRFLRSARTSVKGMVGAHASFTLSDESLDLLARLSDGHGAGIHIHVAEDACDEEDAIRRCGRRAALRLKRARLLRSDSILAHGVHLDDSEFASVREAASWLVHNCRSNMNNSVGTARPSAVGDRAALGTDGIDGDMRAESRAAFFRAREDNLDSTAERFVQMLAAGAGLASQQFGRPIGSLTPGSAADLVILRYNPPTPLTAENVAWHWMFGMAGAEVESVMVGGRWILRDGEFCGLDEEKIRAECRVQAQRLWSRIALL